MTWARTRFRFRLGVLIGLASVTFGAAIFWWETMVGVPTGGRGGPKGTFVQLSTGGGNISDRMLGERADLFDPTPLFFPTGHNFGRGDKVPIASRRLPEEDFANFGPQYRFSEQGLGLYGFEAAAAPEHLSDVLVQGTEVPFAGMGEVEVERKPIGERSGYVSVKDLATGSKVLEGELPGLAVPAGEFSPIEFLAVVGRSGLVGEPVLVANSGSDPLDTLVRGFLVNTYRLGARLAPGRYLVSVGP